MRPNVHRDIVVIGGSAGAIEAIRQLLDLLPANLAASLFVTVHVSPETPSVLPELLSSKKRRARHPSERQRLEQGIVYVAPPDSHLLVERDYVLLGRGPKENRHRPAIDVLFRSAARSYGPRVAAIVMSGQLDDGSSGLMAVKMRGGLTIVQDPQEATAAEMPFRAIQYASPDHVLRIQEIAALLSSVTSEKLPVAKISEPTMTDEPKPREDEFQQVKKQKAAELEPIEENNGRPSVFACPECHGVLWELQEGQLLRFRCRVGHAYTADSLRVALSEASEDSLWVAMRVLEEKADLLRRLASKATPRMKTHYQEEAVGYDRHASAIGKILLENQGLTRKEEDKSGAA